MVLYQANMYHPKVIHNPYSFDYFCIIYVDRSSLYTILKVREGRRAADFPKLCVFLNKTVISEDI